VHAVAVMARGVAPETCLGTVASPSCVVSRRVFEYQPNTRITVPIGLYRQCFGVVCGAEQTCNYEGRCVSARVSTGACGTESGCLIEGEPPVPTGVQDAPNVQQPLQPIPDPPALLAPTLSFRDQDPLRGFARGRLTLGTPVQAALISGYRVFWVGAGGQRIGVAKEWPDNAAPKEWELLPGTIVPAGAETFEAVAIAGARESASVRVRADNYARSVDPELDIGDDIFYERFPFFATDKAGAQVLLVAGSNASLRVSVRRCASDGALCTRHDLGVPGRQGITQAYPAVAMHDNKLYVAETSPDGAFVLHICPEDMASCVTRTLSPPGTHADGNGTEMHIDAARGQVLVVGIEESRAIGEFAPPSEAKAVMVSHRCALDGTQCVRRTLAIPVTYDFGITSDPVSGDLVLVGADVSGDSWPLRLWRCPSDGTPCASTFAEVALPDSERCFVTVTQVPGTRELLATAQAGGCDQVSPTKGIVGLKCDLSKGTCSRHDLRSTPGEREPHLMVDQAKARALVVISDDTKQGTPAVLSCGLDLLGCSKTTIGSGEWQSAVRFAPLPSSGQIYVTGRSRKRSSITVLSRCAGDLSGCSYTDIADSTSVLSRTNNGYDPIVAAGPPGRIAIAAATTQEVSGHVCTAGACARNFRAPGNSAAVAYWPSQKAFVYAIYGGGTGGLQRSMGVAVCKESDSMCLVSDATVGHPEGNQRPIVLPDTAGSEFAIVHETTERGVLEPLITTCDAKGNNCSARFVFASVPSDSHFGLDAKRGAKGALIISSLSDGRVVRSECAAPSLPCVSATIGTAPDAANWAYLGSAVVVRPGGTNVVVGTPVGASLFTCLDGQPCGRVELPIFSAAEGAPLWTTAVADDAHNAFYVALFRKGFRRNDFIDQDDLVGNLEVYRCTQDGSACERTVSRSDIPVVTFYPDYPLFWYGRPASLSLGSDGVLRAAVTDAANLFRPVIIELDSY
jgi:hypothetical protein